MVPWLASVASSGRQRVCICVANGRLALSKENSNWVAFACAFVGRFALAVPDKYIGAGSYGELGEVDELGSGGLKEIDETDREMGGVISGGIESERR